MSASWGFIRRKLGLLANQGTTTPVNLSTVPVIRITSESDEELCNRQNQHSNASFSSSQYSEFSNDFDNHINLASLTMNEEPYLVRKITKHVKDAEKDSQDTDSDDKTSFENHQKVSLESASVSKTAHPKHEVHFKRPVTGSMSVPINKMSLKLYGSEKAVVDEQNRLQRAGSWIIHPYSNFRLMWDSVTLALLLVNIILIPVAIAFWKENEPQWLPFKYVTDVWFLLDIFFNFRTGIVIDGPDSEVILNPREIRAMYLKTWFLIDLVSTFPFDLLFTLMESALNDEGVVNGLNALNLIRLAKLLALLRLLRLSRFIRYMKQWEEIFNFKYEIALAFARIFNQIMFMLFICHFNGCLQYMIPMFLNFPEKTWVRDRNLHLVNVSKWEQYSWSVFKSTSHMLCIGYGQFPPQGLVDVWVTYVSMLSGAMCFALFIGNATSLIQSMDSSKRTYKEKFMQVKEYMQFRKLPSHLRRKVSDYYENRFQGKMFDEKRILFELNHNLREEVINSNCRELIEQVPIFNDPDPYFINDIMAKLEFEMFLMDEPIVQEGSVGHKMYFISRGTVIITSDQHKIKQRLSDGCYFGEVALLQPSLRRVASVVAETYCYLYSLSVNDFNDVLDEYPLQRLKINHFVLSRLAGSIAHHDDLHSPIPSSDEERIIIAEKGSLGEIAEESPNLWKDEV